MDCFLGDAALRVRRVATVLPSGDRIGGQLPLGAVALPGAAVDCEVELGVEGCEWARICVDPRM